MYIKFHAKLLFSFIPIVIVDSEKIVQGKPVGISQGENIRRHSYPNQWGKTERNCCGPGNYPKALKQSEHNDAKGFI